MNFVQIVIVHCRHCEPARDDAATVFAIEDRCLDVARDLAKLLEPGAGIYLMVEGVRASWRITVSPRTRQRRRRAAPRG